MKRFSRILQKQVRSHNEQCVVVSLLSLVLAAVLWGGVYVLYMGTVFFFAAGRYGFEVHPPWFYSAFFYIIGGLFVAAVIGNVMRRFSRPQERPLLGWHLLFDVLLLPPRITFAIFDNLDARVHLTREQVRLAAVLAEVVARNHRVLLHELSMDFPAGKNRSHALLALQIFGWVDRIQSGNDWLYYATSLRGDELRALFGMRKETKDK